MQLSSVFGVIWLVADACPPCPVMIRNTPPCSRWRRGVLFSLVRIVGWLRLARQPCALKSSRLPSRKSLLFSGLFLSLAPYASPRCPFRRDAKRYEIGSSLDLFRLVFLKSGAEGSVFAT